MSIVKYVDGINGSDSNSGDNQYNAWKTLVPKASAETWDILHIKAYDYTVHIYAGPFIVITDNKTVDVYGGDYAYISASVVVTGWTKTGGYTNVYEAVAPSESYGVFEDITGVYGPVSSIADVDATASSHYWDSGTGKTYIHTAGSDDPSGHSIRVTYQDGFAVGGFFVNNSSWKNCVGINDTVGFAIASDGGIVENCGAAYCAIHSYYYQNSNMVIKNPISIGAALYLSMGMIQSGADNTYQDFDICCSTFSVYASNLTSNQYLKDGTFSGASYVQIDTGTNALVFESVLFDETNPRISSSADATAKLIFNSGCVFKNHADNFVINCETGAVEMNGDVTFKDINSLINSIFLTTDCDIDIEHIKIIDCIGSTNVFSVSGACDVNIKNIEVDGADAVSNFSNTGTVNIEYGSIKGCTGHLIVWDINSSGVSFGGLIMKPASGMYCFVGTSANLTSTDCNGFDLTDGLAGYLDASGYATLADWQTATSDEANSSDDVADWVSGIGGDMYLNTGSTYIDFGWETAAVAGLDTRYTGNNADTGTVDIGFHYAEPKEYSGSMRGGCSISRISLMQRFSPGNR